ncbi:MAG: GNAT family N-acetyltransferase [Pseudomarimonas sp.]
MLILPLSSDHARREFDCGNDDLNHWLRQVAGQHGRKGLSRTFVANQSTDSLQILGFYAVTLAELVHRDLPPTLRKKYPPKVPAWRLGRLAVSNLHQGRRIGQVLLFDAIERTSRLAAEGGGVGLVVDAKPEAAAFYTQYGFEPIPESPGHLFLAF